MSFALIRTTIRDSGTGALAKVDLSTGFCDIHMRAISQEMPKNLIHKMN